MSRSIDRFRPLIKALHLDDSTTTEAVRSIDGAFLQTFLLESVAPSQLGYELLLTDVLVIPPGDEEEVVLGMEHLGAELTDKTLQTSQVFLGG